MMNENSELKTAVNLNDSLGFGSMNLKPLVPKNGEDDYYKGNNRKCRKKKKKTSVCTSPVQVSSDQQFWDHERIKDIFPLPCKSQVEVSKDDEEEIQYLSLEDFKVYKKRVPREISPPKDLWQHGDFPSLQNLTADENHMVPSGEGHGIPCGSTGSTPKEGSKMQPNSHSHQDLSRVSTHCQTDGRQLIVDLDSSAPDALLCCKLPHELRGTVMNIISQNFENQSVITLLSCLLYKFMIGVLHETAPVGVLSASDLESIERLLSDEMRNLNYFSLRATRGQNRLQSISSCLNNLFMRFPGLHIMPGFSDLVSYHQQYSTK